MQALGQDPTGRLVGRRRRRERRLVGAFVLGWVALLVLLAALAGPRVAAGIALLAAFAAMLLLVVEAIRGRR